MPVPRETYRGIIANNLTEAEIGFGWVSAVDSEGRTIWVADARRDGKRFVVRADEMTGFLELESAIPTCGNSVLTGRPNCLKTRRRSFARGSVCCALQEKFA